MWLLQIRTNKHEWVGNSILNILKHMAIWQQKLRDLQGTNTKAKKQEAHLLKYDKIKNGSVYCA